MKKTFLTAEWRKLIIANYSVPPHLLTQYLPHGTQLDLWQGKCYVSLIGFLFLNTRLKGVKIPFHATFEEVNLRFYVTFQEGDTLKRGVVFLKEMVPKPAITLVANTLYGEHYETLPMGHSWTTTPEAMAVEYRWKKQGWHSLSVTAHPKPHLIEAGSEEEFITQHFWGYTKLGEKKTSAYEVAHPLWEVYPVQDYRVTADFGTLYGPAFSFLQTQTPASVFLAEGSPILVKEGGVVKVTP